MLLFYYAELTAVDIIEKESIIAIEPNYRWIEIATK